jgi:hypothetical protein
MQQNELIVAMPVRCTRHAGKQNGTKSQRHPAMQSCRVHSSFFSPSDFWKKKALSLVGDEEFKVYDAFAASEGAENAPKIDFSK